MINLLQGTITGAVPNQLTLMVTGMPGTSTPGHGIGYAVYVPEETAFELNQTATLHIHYHWNQDNGPALYGFQSPIDKQVFQLIISCPGIGPKIGLAVLSQMPANTFLAAITTGDVKSLSSISGIGAKKAESMIVYLKSKVEKLVLAQPQVVAGNAQMRNFTELSQALSALNYTRSEVSASIEHVKLLEECKSLAFDGLLRKALVYLSKRM